MNTLLTHLADRGGRFGRHGGAPWLSLIVVLLVGAAVAALVMWLLRNRGASAAAPLAASHTASAESILAERLARSEIDPDEYRRLLAALRGEAPAPVTAAATPADDSAEPTTES
jgi:putative membrane protein